MKETEVRRWLRSVWGNVNPALCWVENRAGGTFGAPDVFMPVDSGLGRNCKLFVGVELKVGKPRGGFITVDLRADQWAWHLQAHRGNLRTLILVGWTEEDSKMRLLLISPAFLASLGGEIHPNEGDEIGKISDREQLLIAVKTLLESSPEKSCLRFG